MIDASEIESRLYFGSICLFAIINPLIAQIGWYFFPDRIAGLSLMQWYQGLFFVYVLATIPFLRKHSNILSKQIYQLLSMFIVGFTIIHLRAWGTGNIDPDYVMIERIYYFKIIFAITLWYYVSLVINNTQRADVLLKCIIAGSIVTSLCIFYFYFTSTDISEAYAYEGVKASTGVEGVSGKGTAGFLVPSVFLVLYLSMKNRSKYGIILALFILAATYLTYGRAGQVAFCCGLMWLISWYFFFSNRKINYNTIIIFVVLLFIGAFLYFRTYGYEELFSRWTYDLSKGAIGSGRGIFYSTALKWFTQESSFVEFFLGMGFGNIRNIMFYNSGIRVHTHSDFFDMMLTGGVLGLLLYSAFLWTAFDHVRKTPKISVEFLVMSSIFIVFCVMSFLTGIFIAPHAIFSFLAALYCMKRKNSESNL